MSIDAPDTAGEADGSGEPLAASLSIVIPMYNEQDNVAPMMADVHRALAAYPAPWELVVVDDGSTDQTRQRLQGEAARYGEHVRVRVLRRNFGQTAAMQAGIDAARGEVIATLDGDLQNDPQDIPRMVDQFLRRDLDLLCGWRADRQDTWLMRKLPSRIANWLIGRVTGVRITDYGCSLKVYRAEVIKGVRLYGEMHRFIPVWVASATSPLRIDQTPVNHRPRVHGVSKYGLSRTFRVVLDLLVVFFFLRYHAKPGHFFGGIGLSFGALGSLVLAYLGVVKFVLGEDIGSRPLLFVGILLVIASLQFLTTGILGELLSRTYYESTAAAAYRVRVDDAESHTAWAGPRNTSSNRAARAQG
ncbi:MAG: glycosyltransferase family 2 protein [Pseudomonadota bacterium]